jgi:hypothetical protein
MKQRKCVSNSAHQIGKMLFLSTVCMHVVWSRSQMTFTFGFQKSFKLITAEKYLKNNGQKIFEK